MRWPHEAAVARPFPEVLNAGGAAGSFVPLYYYLIPDAGQERFASLSVLAIWISTDHLVIDCSGSPLQPPWLFRGPYEYCPLPSQRYLGRCSVCESVPRMPGPTN